MKHSLQLLHILPWSNSFARLPEAFYTQVQLASFETATGLSHCNRAAAELLDPDPALAAGLLCKSCNSCPA